MNSMNRLFVSRSNPVVPSAPPLETTESKLQRLQDRVYDTSCGVWETFQIKAEVEQIAAGYINQDGLNKNLIISQIFDNTISPLQQSISDKIRTFEPEEVRNSVLEVVKSLDNMTLETRESTIAMCRYVMREFRLDWNQVLGILKAREEPQREVLNPLVGKKECLESPIAGFSHVRNVKDGGSGYYRALMINLLEQVLDPKNPKRSDQCLELVRTFSRLDPSLNFDGPRITLIEGSPDLLAIRKLVRRLTEASIGDAWVSVENFLEEVNNDKSEIDKALVKGARYLLSDHVLKVFNDDIANLTGCRNHQELYDKYCLNHIMRDDEILDESFIGLGLLAETFNFSLINIPHDKSLPKIETGNGDLKVAVLRRGSDYRILYPQVVEAGSVADHTIHYKFFFCAFLIFLISVYVNSFIKTLINK